MRSGGEGWLPINGSPVALVTWYAPLGPVALLTPWVAVISDQPPALRAGCSVHLAAGTVPPDALDFAVNIPTEPPVPALQALLARAVPCVPLLIDDATSVTPARSVHAPLLAGCALQIECACGRVTASGWDAELAGEIVLLHRGGLLVAPATYPDFCALQPLRTRYPS